MILLQVKEGVQEEYMAHSLDLVIKESITLMEFLLLIQKDCLLLLTKKMRDFQIEQLSIQNLFFFVLQFQIL